MVNFLIGGLAENDEENAVCREKVILSDFVDSEELTE